jgi:hypothetical protein
VVGNVGPKVALPSVFEPKVVLVDSVVESRDVVNELVVEAVPVSVPVLVETAAAGVSPRGVSRSASIGVANALISDDAQNIGIA